MRGAVRRAAEVGLVPTVALATALALAPERAELEVHVWLVVVLTLGLAVVVGGIGGARPAVVSVFDRARRADAKGRARPASLSRLEREVTMASSTAFDVHYRLRPALRELASGLLRARRGVDLELSPARARELLGDELWELVRLDRAAPHDHGAPGITAATLERCVTALERL